MNWRTTIVCTASVPLLAACSLNSESIFADGRQSPEASLVITGNLYYPERIALPPDSEAVVELLAGEATSAETVAEWRDTLDGRQVPIPFALEVAPDRLVEGATHRLRGSVHSQPGLLRVTEAVVIDARSGKVELGNIRLHLVQVMDLPLPFIARGQEPGWHLRIDADAMVLRAHYGEEHLNFPRPNPEFSAEGSRYVATANGRRLSVQVIPGVCRDTMTGMPHPFRVVYQLDEDRQTGCGGDPAMLLSGPEWRIERLGDSEVLDGSNVTIQFLGEDSRVAGSASCNRFSAGMRLTGEGLRIEQLAVTMMSCADPDLTAQEDRLLTLLQAVKRFDIDEQGRLLLHVGEQQTILASR